MSLYKYVITDPPPSRYSQHQPHKSLNLPIKKLIEPFKPLNPKPFKGTLVEPLRTLDGYPSIMKSNWACRRSSLQQGLITSEVSAEPQYACLFRIGSYCDGYRGIIELKRFSLFVALKHHRGVLSAVLSICLPLTARGSCFLGVDVVVFPGRRGSLSNASDE